MPNPLKKNVKMVGAYVPTDLANKLALLSVSRGRTRTKLLLDFISEGVGKSQSVSELTETIARNVMARWDGDKFREYCKAVEKALKKKHLTNHHIKLIIYKMRKFNGTN